MSYNFAKHLRGQTPANVLKQKLVTRQTDPYQLINFDLLPNPDPVLRKLGKSDEIYHAIMSDAHVVGELRSQRAGLFNWETQIKPGGDDVNSMRAFDIISEFMRTPPTVDEAITDTWDDVNWSVYSAVFFGRRYHELVWDRVGDYHLPVQIIDHKSTQFGFNADRELRQRVSGLPGGKPVPSQKIIVSRHMPSNTNPYGIAVFSSCFWPYTFKHGGMKFFHRFCEKYGIPWVFGEYTPGTPEAEQDRFADQLAAMVEDAVAVVPSDAKIQIVETKSTGEPVPERLVNLCNREMSKALAAQALTTEVVDVGSRASAEAGRDRENDVASADRKLVINFYNTLFRWITQRNVNNAKPPEFEFFEESDAQTEWVENFEKASKLISIPHDFIYDKLQIPKPEKDQTATVVGSQSALPPAEFSRDHCPQCAHEFRAPDNVAVLINDTANEADKLIVEMAEPILELLESVDTLEEFRDQLFKLYPGMDDTRLAELTQQAMTIGYLNGMDTAE